MSEVIQALFEQDRSNVEWIPEIPYVKTPQHLPNYKGLLYPWTSNPECIHWQRFVPKRPRRCHSLVRGVRMLQHSVLTIPTTMYMHEEHKWSTDLTKAKAQDYTSNHLYAGEPGCGHCPFPDEKQPPRTCGHHFVFG